MPTNIPLVSIIIPTFNRAHLIGETLDSVLAQTYQNWECIVVDDGSTDDTDEIMAGYVGNDARFQYYHRPSNQLKGAPVCRNIGLENATGDYIIFFDSDDLMTSEHIRIKLIPLLDGNYDFSITKTKFFNVVDASLERYYNFNEFEITAHNYIVQNINWLTYDACIKSTIAKSIQFNENLKSGQEFNYFSKLILKTQKCVFINDYVSLRRKHDDSIQSKLVSSNSEQYGNFFTIWETYKDIKPLLIQKTKKELLFKCVKLLYAQKRFFVKDKVDFFKELYFNYGNSAFYLFPMIIMRRYSNGGYYFRQKLKNKANN